MLRNTAAAVRNPLTEINKIYSQTLQTTQPNRPFSSISKLPDSTLVVDFILLPHQVAVFPLELLAKITWPSSPLLEDLDGEELRYFLSYLKKKNSFTFFDVLQSHDRSSGLDDYIE